MSRLIKQTVLTASVALITLAFTACGSTGSGTGTGTTSPGGATDVAATVNSKNIMLSEVDRLINQKFQGQQSKLSPLQLAQTRLQALDTLIQQEVLFQRAEKQGLIPKDDEINQVLTVLKQQSGMTEEEFQKRLKEQGQTVEMLRDEARRSKAIEKLQDQINAKITVRDEEVSDYYNTNKQQFINPRGVGLANIVVDPAENGLQDDAKNETEAKVKVDNIYAQLKSGADFATVARARSEDVPEVRERGGDLGFATEDALKQNGFPVSLVEQFFGPLQVGSYTPPIQFPNKRWYIFKLQSKQLQNENLTFDSPGVRQQITQALTDQRKQILNAALLEVAMTEAKVVNNLAADMLAKPEMMSGMRQATPGTTASPAASPASSPATSPVVPPAASPSASATPQATATPASTVSPAPNK
ncbi:MAG: SurA N-terminal domain-containing protein [Acidobacteria bacterium]|nr:SurA N-terminal domain-containing protein [Acidobacteriota bacterium]